MSPGRNAPCPCGSGRKFKLCCGRAGASAVAPASAAPAPDAGQRSALLDLFRTQRHGELLGRLAALLERFPQSAFLWGLLGATQQSQGADGLPALQRAVALAPDDADAQANLGAALLERGQPQAAAACLRKALELAPANLPARINLAQTLRALGDASAAIDAYRGVLARAPKALEAHFGLLDLLLECAEVGEAESLAQRALELAPAHCVAHFCLGNVRQRQGRLADALVCYQTALELAPGFAPAASNLACALLALGRSTEAEDVLLRSLRSTPGYLDAYLNLARLYLEQGRFAAAEPVYRDALAVAPEGVAAREGLAQVLRELGRADEADALCEQALAIDPLCTSARLLQAVCRLPIVADTPAASAAVGEGFLGELDRLAEWLFADARRGARLHAGVAPYLPFFLAYRPGNHCPALSRFADLVCPPSPPLAPRHSPRGKLRLLVVAHHVHRHSVWEIVLRGLLEQLDRRHFALTVHHLGQREDEATRHARTLADTWRDAHSVSNLAAWQQACVADRPDVIFYPELGMDPLSFHLAAQRFAPLQLAGWGHPITSGLPTIDCFVSGELLEPPGAAAHYRERLLLLPGTGCCTTSPAPVVAPVPEVERRLREMPGVRFLIAQRAIKFEPADDALFAMIAAQAGECVFIVVDDPLYPWAARRVHARLARAFSERGVDPARHLLLVPWLSAEAFPGLLDLADVFLDCPGFSGYTTAWQAVHRGLPVLTLAGDFLRQRLAAGLLHKIGQAESVAASAEQYLALALQLAAECRDAQRRAARRAALQAAAPRADNDLSVVRAFEQAIVDQLAGAAQTCRPSPKERGPLDVEMFTR